jgi:hypothetical protein
MIRLSLKQKNKINRFLWRNQRFIPRFIWKHIAEKLCYLCGADSWENQLWVIVDEGRRCRDCNPSSNVQLKALDKDNTRALYWQDIQSRVTTHEGEFLSGRAGREYQEKWSKKMLGKDLTQTRRADAQMVKEYQYKKEGSR